MEVIAKGQLGQLVSKGLFGVIVSTKKTMKFFEGFLPWPLKRVQIKKPSLYDYVC